MCVFSNLRPGEGTEDPGGEGVCERAEPRPQPGRYSIPTHGQAMRLRFAGAILLAVAAYYVYLPLPGGVSEPWKLMLLDALIRGFMRAVSTNWTAASGGGLR